MSLLNQKNIIVDADNVVEIASVNNPTKVKLTVYRDVEYTIKAKVLEDYLSSTGKTLDANDRYMLAISNAYGEPFSAMLTTQDISANVASSELTILLNMDNNDIAQDLGNSASKTYYMQVWGVNDVDTGYLILDADIVIHNIAIES
jgi:hypothetical protein